MADRGHGLDDDTVNRLNAEVRRQRAEALTEDHLATMRGLSAEQCLPVAAQCLRFYEVMRQLSRAQLPMRERCMGPMDPRCRLCGGALDLANSCKWCAERGGL